MPPFYFLTFAKVSVSVSKKFGLKKSRYRFRKIWSRKKVSVSVSKILVSKKSLGIGLDEIFWSRHSVLLTQRLPTKREEEIFNTANQSLMQSPDHPPVFGKSAKSISFAENRRLFVKHFKSTQNIIVKFFLCLHETSLN